MLLTKKNGMTVFLFHEISKNKSPFQTKFDLSVSPSAFEKHILWIKQNFLIIDPVILSHTNKVPKNSALVTFDDGFRGSFEFGLPICKKHNIKPIFFLNLGDIMETKVLWPALIEYLKDNNNFFKEFLKKEKLKYPEFLFIPPKYYKRIKKTFLQKTNYKLVQKFCGPLISLQKLKQINLETFYLGNHSYFHWPFSMLSRNDIKNNILKNHKKLSEFKNMLHFLSLPFGDLPKSGSTNGILKDLSYKYCFGSKSVINSIPLKKNLGRICLGEDEYSNDLRWFRFGRKLLLN